MDLLTHKSDLLLTWFAQTEHCRWRTSQESPWQVPAAAERSALIIAMSLHEKGRAALKRRDYPAALVLLLEADIEFSACSSDLLRMVDNYAILSLDIAWC